MYLGCLKFLYPPHGEDSVVKFADTTIINDETSYWVKIDNLAEWCTKNNLPLNSKIKELIDDFRKKDTKTYTSVYISGTEVEQGNSFRY